MVAIDTMNNAINESSDYFPFNWEETVPVLMTKTNTYAFMESESASFNPRSCCHSSSSSSLLQHPTTPSTSPRTIMDCEEWSFVPAAPRCQRPVLYMSDSFLSNAPRLPFLNDDDDAIDNVYQRHRLPLRIYDNDESENDGDWLLHRVPSLPRLDGNDNQKENVPPVLLLPRMMNQPTARMSCFPSCDDRNGSWRTK